MRPSENTRSVAFGVRVLPLLFCFVTPKNRGFLSTGNLLQNICAMSTLLTCIWRAFRLLRILVSSDWPGLAWLGGRAAGTRPGCRGYNHTRQLRESIRSAWVCTRRRVPGTQTVTSKRGASAQTHTKRAAFMNYVCKSQSCMVYCKRAHTTRNRKRITPKSRDTYALINQPCMDRVSDV